LNSLETALNKVAKWRTVLTGWQLGTRPKGDPECDAIRDHREATILLRAEVTALTAVLLKKGLMSEAEYAAELENEARLLDQSYERRFPGFKTHQYGVDIDVAKAWETTRGWKP
jgi:hypothetical protein